MTIFTELNSLPFSSMRVLTWLMTLELNTAARGGHLLVVERLLAAKADVNAAPARYHGRTALQAAAEGDHLPVVERLLASKADVNAAPAWSGGRIAKQAGGFLGEGESPVKKQDPSRRSRFLESKGIPGRWGHSWGEVVKGEFMEEADS
jgi:Ankyrin repeats (3 copies)